MTDQPTEFTLKPSHLSRFALVISLLFITLLAQPALAQVQADAPIFSISRGFFATPFAVNLSTTTPAANIRYTTDGTTPSATVGTLYTDPIGITTTTPLRAIVYAGGMFDSTVVTHTYIFLADVINQGNNPPGYPAEFAADNGFGPYPADYEMDPEVVDDPAYSSIMPDVLTNIPTMSIVTDISNLFDPATGIYYNAEQSGVAWERPNSVELIFPDGRSGFQVNSGIRTHGKGSRDPRISPKKSFRLYFRSEYGPSKLEFPLFDDPKAAVKFDKLVLRGGSNNKWLHWSKFQRPVALYVRDEFARRSQLAMGQVSPRDIYVHLYINGLYWGLYNVAERIDDEYVASYFGGDPLDWDVIKPDDFGGVEAAEGNLLAWQTVQALVEEDMTNDANYQAVLHDVDMVSLADYIILIHYIENTDWPDRNWYAVRNRTEGTFKFIAWDSELSLKNKERNIIDVDYPGSPAHLFQRLRANPEFRALFADRVYKHLLHDGALTAVNTEARFRQLTNLVELPVVGESARWGDYRRDVYQRPDVGDQSPYELYTRDTHWVPQRDKMLEQYFPVRTDNVIANYVAANLFPDLAPPAFSQEGGQIIPGYVLTIDNGLNSNRGTIYYTIDGSDPRSYGGTISPKANNGGDLVNVALFGSTSVKARVKDGAIWSALHEAAFVAPQDLSGLVINEIMYHPPADAGLDGDEYEFIELTNAGAAPLDLASTAFTAGIFYTFPAGVTLAAGDYLVLASNAAAFAGKYGFDPDGVYTVRLKNSGEQVVLGDGLGNMVDEVTYGDLPPWPTDPDGLGSSLELVEPGLNNALPESWQASLAAGGTPKAENSVGTTDPCVPVPPLVVINEINYNSAAAFNPEDWVELANPQATAVDLSGWAFQDEAQAFTLPAGTTLDGHGYLVLVRDAALFQSVFPGVDNVIGDLGFGFSGGGERLRLLSPTGCTVDDVAYSDLPPWPITPDGGGPTLALLDLAQDNSLPQSWAASVQVGGTPGGVNWESTPADKFSIYLPFIK